MKQNHRADILPDNIPQCLRERDQWVVWRYVMRAGRQTKMPFDAKTGGDGDSTKPATWAPFAQAISAWRSNLKWSGIGFVFSADDPYCGVDLDECIDLETGEMKAWAREQIEALDTYCEVSPSGGGVKLFTAATKPGPRCKTKFHDGEIEIYDQERFFTVTGQSIGHVSPHVEQRQDALEALYTRAFGSGQSPDPTYESADDRTSSTPLTDEQIVEHAKRSKSGAKFSALWAGRWNDQFGSQSEADSSLIFMLAFYTKDGSQLDRLFRRSGLMRPKWDEKHGTKTYGEGTVEKALTKVTAQYQPRRPRKRSTEEKAGYLVPLGEREPETGRLVLSPKKTLPTAQAFIEEFYSQAAVRTLHSYAGAVLIWRGNRYTEIEEGSLRQQLQPWLHDALRYQLSKESGQLELVDFDSNPGTINAALESLRAFAHLPVSTTPPSWLDGRADALDPRNLLPFPSGTLDLVSGKTLPPTPALFNINAIDFNYEPNPEPPERWIKLIEQLWGDDLESVQLLQEWMGYCLVADTSQQKMLLMVGPKRSGKGTIGRVLTRLVGVGNVVGPTTSSLAGPFGLQPLIGKTLAIVSDARFSGDNVGVVVERLLCISGEDTLTVDRKFLGSVTMKVPTRFVFLTNELPRMNDSSGALAGRFVILRLTRSFYGEEDVTLTQQLMAELPGILVWAIEGLMRLQARGHFVQPQSVADAVQEMEDLASPVLAFVRDCCEVGTGRRTWIDEMYGAWKRWCERDGRTIVTSRQTFGRDLAAAAPGVACRRHSVQGRFYDGIALREGGAE